MKDVLLYGAGTQSTGLLLMMCDGYNGMAKPDMVIFSDTGAEPDFIIDYMRKVSAYVNHKFGVIILEVNNGNLDYDIRHGTGRIASLPLFTANGGMIRRQCTEEYKIRPASKLIKDRLNIKRKTKDWKPAINRIFGISLDEIERCRVSTDWWAINKYPLVENRMYRHEVINYINDNHPDLSNPPRSACYFCPFHSDSYWRNFKEKHPKWFDKACEIDDKIRIKPKMKEELFVHRSLRPLRDIDFTNLQYEIFGECEGYCGM